LQPNLTMKGRTPESLLRQVAMRHRDLAKFAQPEAEWASSGIPGFEFTQGSELGDSRVWTINELLSSKALYAEGRVMHHCVASYAYACARGVSSIWTMHLIERGALHKVLTIEVNRRSRVVCQAKGPCNRSVTQRQLGLIRRWAEKAGLQLATYL